MQVESAEQSQPSGGIIAVCTHCGQAYEVDSSSIGEIAECQTCGELFIIEKNVSLTQPAPEADQPAPVVISVVKKGRRLSLRKIMIIPSATILAVIAAIGTTWFVVKNDSRSTQLDGQKSWHAVEVTIQQREAMSTVLAEMFVADALGETIRAMAQQSDKERFPPELFAVAAFVSQMSKIDSSGCPADFEAAWQKFKIAYTIWRVGQSMKLCGKKSFSKAIEKEVITNKLLIDAYDRVSENGNDVQSSFDDARRDFLSAISRYGGIDRMKTTIEKHLSKFVGKEVVFANISLASKDVLCDNVDSTTAKRNSPERLADKLASSQPYFRRLDDTTVMWDVGGEDPPFLCSVKFRSDGTACLMEDITFFAVHHRDVSPQKLAATLERLFWRQNKWEREMFSDIKAFVGDGGKLFFRGEFSVNDENVCEKVEKAFHCLNVVRISFEVM